MLLIHGAEAGLVDSPKAVIKHLPPRPTMLPPHLRLLPGCLHQVMDYNHCGLGGPSSTGSAAYQREDFAELRQLISELQLELRRLRRDNELLRQAQVAAAGPGLSQASAVPPPFHTSSHQCPVCPPSLPELNTSMRLPPYPLPNFSPIKPLDSSEVSMTPPLGHRERGQDGATPEAKRPSHAARSLEVGPPNV